MSLSFGGSKQKSSQQQTQNQTSTFTPNAQFLSQTQGGLDRALGLMGGYKPTSQASIQSYLNPMQDTISAGIRREGDIAANNNDAQAAAASAFGGSGWGLLRGETERAALDAEAMSRATGYNTALQAAMGENQASQGYDLQALQTYLSGLGLLGNWGTTNTSGTSSGTSKGSGMNFGVSATYGG